MQTERRSSPRLFLNSSLRLNMTCSGGKRAFAAENVNLSQGGIDLNCDSEVFTILQEQPQFPYTCQLSFIMPDSQCFFTSRCRLLSHRRLSQNKYRLGFRFIAFSEQNEQKLIDYLKGQKSTAG